MYAALLLIETVSTKIQFLRKFSFVFVYFYLNELHIVLSIPFY